MPHDVTTACSFAGELPVLYHEVLVSCGRMSLQVREANCAGRAFQATALLKPGPASPFRMVAFDISASESAGLLELMIRAQTPEPSARQVAFTAFKSEELMGLVKAALARHGRSAAAQDAPQHGWRTTGTAEPGAAPHAAAHGRLQFDRGDLVRLSDEDPIMQVLASSPYLTMCGYEVDGSFRRCTIETTRLHRVPF